MTKCKTKPKPKTKSQQATSLTITGPQLAKLPSSFTLRLPLKKPRTPKPQTAPRPHGIERNAIGASAALQQALEDERARLRATHHPMPLALVLQFYGGDGTKAHPGDKPAALALARMIADIEPHRRDDVCLVLARQVNTPMDEEIEETGLYVGHKMPVIQFGCRTTELGRGYPGEVYEMWMEVMRRMSDGYYTGRLPYSNVFMFEADGCPMSRDWIDRLKRAHDETLRMGKRITGPVMRYPLEHVNGTMALHLSIWPDRPSLHRCPPTNGWDCFHSQVFLTEANQSSQIIRNEYGMGGMSESVWWTLGREAAWVTSVKDGLHQHWARLHLATNVPNWRRADWRWHP